MRALINRTKEFIQRNDRTLSGGALLVGFIIDSLTLRRIDLLIENLAVIFYLGLAMLSIIILAHREREHTYRPALVWAVTVAPIALQFAFGALFSAFVIFYFRSASLSASWPFLFFLLFMLVGNEAFRSRYERIVFHVSVLFLALLSYSIMLVPILSRSIGPLEFVLGVVLSLLLITGFVFIMRLIAPREVGISLQYIVYSIGGISVACMCAYIVNIIPPVPLALSDSAVAHWLSHEDDAYVLYVEPRGVFDWLTLSEDYHRVVGEPVYVWTSVFAPARLSTSVVHEWQYLDGNRWITENTVAFPLTGGREEGYRTYSMKENIRPGAWRVSVETREGLVIGRVRFDIVESTSSARLIELTK